MSHELSSMTNSTSAREFVKQKKGKLNYGSLHTVWYIVNHIVQAKRTEAV